MKPTITNVPLPLLNPRPDHISGMIHKRCVARRRRVERQRTTLSQIEDIRVETEFERSLATKGARFEKCLVNPITLMAGSPQVKAYKNSSGI